MTNLTNLTFLWRENYIGYLWASNVTAKAYFLDSGFLIYEHGVLSAYATSQELDAASNLTSKLFDNPQEILKLEKNFQNIRGKIKKLKPRFFDKKIRKISDKDLYGLFMTLIEGLKDYICTYRWTEPHYIEKIEQTAFNLISGKISEKESVEKVIAKILSGENKKIYAKYKLNDQMIKMLRLLNEIAKMRFEAKKINALFVSLSEKILREAARRTYFAVSQISQFSLQELKDLLLRGSEPNIKRINKRQKEYALEINVLNNSKVEELSEIRTKELIKYDRRQDELDSFKGLTVYPGIISGTVRVVPTMSGAKEYKEFIKTLKHTNVIVAPMTVPELASVFSKVAAVITDEGGLMSHAALVAREKKVPCIIGTRIATRALRDGDVVTVDANNGVVTKHL